MKGNKHRKPNPYQMAEKESGILNFGFEHTLDVCIRLLLTVAGVAIVSLALILAHDLVTQSRTFAARSISVSGLDRLTRSEVLARAEVNEGDNLIKLNLFRIKKRLISHPWIQDAAVKRTLPDALELVIREEKPLALATMGEVGQLVINEDGEPFIESAASAYDLTSLPVVTGLWLEEDNGIFRLPTRLLNCVMDVLMLEKQGEGTRASSRSAWRT